VTTRLPPSQQGAYLHFHIKRDSNRHTVATTLLGIIFRAVQSPPHTLLVHFPFVLWGMSFIFDVVSRWCGPAMAEAALFNLIAGFAAAGAATVTGFWDYAKRLAPRSKARRFARWHALATAAATALFAASLACRWHIRGVAATPRLPFVLSALGVAMLGVVSYLGGVVTSEQDFTTHSRSANAH
jgi:uncharacterized membrane protein